MESLRYEVKPFGVRVVLIEPGDFKTDITRHRQKTADSTLNSTYRSTFKKVLQTVESGERNAPTPEPIGKLVNKIINQNSPRLRYSVSTISQRAAIPLKKFLPSRIFESLMAKIFHCD